MTKQQLIDFFITLLICLPIFLGSSGMLLLATTTLTKGDALVIAFLFYLYDVGYTITGQKTKQ
jgi:hypothetical protein